MLGAGKGKFVPISSMTITTRAQSEADAVDAANANIDPREVDTSDKIVLCGLHDGSFELFDLRTKETIFQSAETGSSSALNAIACESEHGFVATGTANGVVKVYEMRDLEKPLICFRRNTASIEDLTFLSLDPDAFQDVPDTSSAPPIIQNTSSTTQEIGLAIATEDGLPFVADVYPSGQRVRAELVGGNCDAVKAVKWAAAAIWTASDDGIVRQYRT